MWLMLLWSCKTDWCLRWDLDCEDQRSRPHQREEEDRDGDVWTEEDGDCDDDEVDVYPGAPEWCDGIDNDCDEVIDADICTYYPYKLVKENASIEAAMLVNDLNGDSTPDMLIKTEYDVRLFSAPPAIPFSLENFDLSFPQVNSNVLSMGDMNGDEYPDLFLGPGINILFGPLSEDSLAWSLDNNISIIRPFYAGDATGDGLADVWMLVDAEATEASRSIQLYSGEDLSTSVVSKKIAEAVAEVGLSGVIHNVVPDFVGDVNGDGFDDLLVTIEGEKEVISEDMIYYSDPDISFLLSGPFSGFLSVDSDASWRVERNFATPGRSAIHRAAGDVNGDGYDDIILIHKNSAILYYAPLSGESLPEDSDAILSYTENEFPFLSVGSGSDLDMDGQTDLVFCVSGQQEYNGTFLYIVSDAPNGTVLLEEEEHRYKVPDSFMYVHPEMGEDLDQDGVEDFIAIDAQQNLLLFSSQFL